VTGGEPTATAPSVVRFRPHHLLAFVPAVCMLGGVPFANRVHRFVFGLPFLALWILCWVIATAGFMTLLYWIDSRATAGATMPEGTPPT
jgi:uncharacterized protein DUF3311